MIIALVQTKGGSGKSTLAAHLAGWAAAKGIGVALLDADPQRASSRWLAEARPDIPRTVAVDADAILDLAPKLAATVGLLVIDAPGGGAEPTRAALLRADLALLPCGPSVLDLRALVDTARIVRQAQSVRSGPPAALVVLNRQRPHERVSAETIEAAALAELPIAQTIVRQRTAIADSAGQGQLVFDMGAAARDAAADFQSLFAELPL